ncbi:MAG: hypothetical protein HF981_21720 [Desulfobacteraceae bacterium]|nr:hypothetical protein [Desulfobacteraceae bacterium]MBC2753029.1 hypothetical protein [Desulfobacteraceae bacterium]
MFTVIMMSSRWAFQGQFQTTVKVSAAPTANPGRYWVGRFSQGAKTGPYRPFMDRSRWAWLIVSRFFGVWQYVVVKAALDCCAAFTLRNECLCGSERPGVTL